MAGRVLGSSSVQSSNPADVETRENPPAPVEGWKGWGLVGGGRAPILGGNKRLCCAVTRDATR